MSSSPMLAPELLATVLDYLDAADPTSAVTLCRFGECSYV